MKTSTAIKLIFLAMVFFALACKNNKNKDNMTTTQETSLFEKGDKLPGEYFTGDAYLKLLLNRDSNSDFIMGSVTFEPGARTVWHTHPKGQVLIVTEGQGWYQEKGKAAQSIRKGDVVNIPENVKHWHGASSKSKMVHIAITNYKDDVNVVWLNPVTEADYAEVNK
jgi:quercetin dioxygenase-like cupin family protein